jgi:hypothetical protein
MISASDASETGMVGIHFIPQSNGSMQPFKLLPTELTTWLGTDVKPSGNITISNLELAATVTHHDVLVHYVKIWEQTTNNLHDNASSLCW